MEDKTRGQDAADVAPRPETTTEKQGETSGAARSRKSDLDADDLTIPTGDLNSANDE